MLAAALAFTAQGTMVVVSQIAAANGSMPHPAVTVSGSLHYHDPLARHFHVHHGQDAGTRTSTNQRITMTTALRTRP